MKTLALPLIAFLFTLSACAQSSHLDKVCRQYNNDDNQLSIDPGALLNVSFSGKKITSLHCLIIDGKKTPSAAREFRDLEHAIHADNFEEWFSIRKGNSKIAVYSLDGSGDLKDLACLITGDDDGGLFFHLRGHFTAEDKERIKAALEKQDHE
jgi:hypothetical protein